MSRRWRIDSDTVALLSGLETQRDMALARVRMQFDAMIEKASELAAMEAGVPDEDGLSVRREGAEFVEQDGAVE